LQHIRNESRYVQALWFSAARHPSVADEQEIEMGDLTRIVNDIVRLLVRLGGSILAAVQAIEMSLRGQLSAAGVPPTIQTLILVAAAIGLMLLAVRIFGGLLRFFIIVVLILLAMKVLFPAMMLPSQ
jgi:hypothetical protein